MNVGGAGGAMNVEGAGGGVDVDGAGGDADAARAASTTWPMRSRYISCHARANGSIFSMSAIKILDS
jgi:hypothetical protein